MHIMSDEAPLFEHQQLPLGQTTLIAAQLSLPSSSRGCRQLSLQIPEHGISVCCMIAAAYSFINKHELLKVRGSLALPRLKHFIQKDIGDDPTAPQPTHHAADVACQSKCCEVVVVLAVLVEVANINLHTCVVLRCDQLVSPRAAY